MTLLAVRGEMIYNLTIEWDIEVGHSNNDMIARMGERLWR